jgi:hypothetical protein
LPAESRNGSAQKFIRDGLRLWKIVPGDAFSKFPKPPILPALVRHCGTSLKARLRLFFPLQSLVQNHFQIGLIPQPTLLRLNPGPR